MVEVPSLLFQLDELLERVDFLSVGSNDLMQFLYAADRGNPRVSDRFDPLSAPVLRALKDIADKAKKHGKPVTLCGELASQPIGALALAIVGYRYAVTVAVGGRAGEGAAARSRLPQRRGSAPALPRQAGRQRLDPPYTRRFRGGRGTAALITLPQQKMDALLDRHALVESELASGLSADAYVKLSREFSELGPVVESIKAYRDAESEIADLAALIDDAATDAEMRKLADAERHALQERKEKLAEQIRLALLPKDAMDDHNAILEIRAGTGGDEAALFAGDLFRMYERYAASRAGKRKSCRSAKAPKADLRKSSPR